MSQLAALYQQVLHYDEIFDKAGLYALQQMITRADRDIFWIVSRQNGLFAVVPLIDELRMKSHIKNLKELKRRNANIDLIIHFTDDRS